MIQRACGISAVRANKGGSSLEGLFGAPTVWSVLGRQLSHFCAAAGESLRRGGGLLCTAQFSLHSHCLSLFAGHLRAQSSGAVSWLIIPGWDGIFIPKAGLEQSWPWTLACSGQEPWADSVLITLCIFVEDTEGCWHQSNWASCSTGRTGSQRLFPSSAGHNAV